MPSRPVALRFGPRPLPQIRPTGFGARWAPTLACLLVIALSAAPLRAEPLLRVIGEGMAEATPDTARLVLGVRHEAREAAAAMEGASRAMEAVLARLAEQGIAPADIRTEAVQISPRRAGSSLGGGAVAGYEALNEVSVRVRALESLGAVLDGVLGDGANSLRALSLELADPAPLQDTARARAVADAYHRARVLADAAGLALGPVRELAEGGAGTSPGPFLRGVGIEAFSAPAAVPIAEGTVQIRAQVSMVFELIAP